MPGNYGDASLNGTYGGPPGATYGGEDVRTDRTWPVLGTARDGVRTGGSAKGGIGISGTARRNTWQ